MFKYRDVLQEKANAARNEGKTSLLNAILKRIDAIMVIIDAAFMYTVNKEAPTLVQFIDAKMFDPDALRIVLPQYKNLQLPQQGKINFSIVEEVVEDSGTQMPLGLKEQMQKILERNFVSKIPEAVAKYKELTNSNEPDSIVWIKIKDMLEDKRLIVGWDRAITGKLINRGPIEAFYSIKKHLKDWSDMDICIVLEDATKRTAKHIPVETESEKILNRSFGIMEKFQSNIRDFLNDQPTLEAIKQYAGIEDKTKAGQHMAQLAQFLVPSKRAKILTRKEYIEKGY